MMSGFEEVVSFRHNPCACNTATTARKLTMLNITCKPIGVLTAAVAVVVLLGCSKRPNEQTAAGSVDTSAGTSLTTVTPAVGPGVQVTRTDAKSEQKALEYELTQDNFAKFLAAADSIAALEGRDSATRNHLAANITDAASTDADAGLRWLESSDSLNRVINSAGISVRDYYVTSLAAAAAARFLNDPKAAPGTPTLRKNADFLKTRQTDLEHLQALRENKPLVTVKP
jgi:hypothetical protein